MRGFIKGIGIGAGVYSVAIVFALGVVYGIKAQQRLEHGCELRADRVMFDSVKDLDDAVDETAEACNK